MCDAQLKEILKPGRLCQYSMTFIEKSPTLNQRMMRDAVKILKLLVSVCREMEVKEK